MITSRFLKKTEQLWNDFNNHPFVKGIADGSLEKEKFKHYIIQDTLYLKDYARAFLIGAAKSEDMEVMSFLATGGCNMINSQDDVNKRYMRRMGLTLEEIYSTPFSLDNLSYVSYMIRIAYEGGAAEALAAIMPCALSYEAIAKRMIANNPKCVENSFYGDFISNYARDAFHENNEKMILLIDNLSKDYDEDRKKNLVDIFVRSSEYEMLFWNLSWELK